MKLFEPLRSWKGGPLALFTAIVLTTAIMWVSHEVIEGLLGWALKHLDISNEAGTFQLNLGAIVKTVLKAGISVFAMLFILKGSGLVTELKDMPGGEEQKADA